MGVCKSKPKPRKSLLSETQRESLSTMFRPVNAGKPAITKHTVIVKWREILTEYLLNLFTEYLFKTDDIVELEDLEAFYYNMVEGPTENRALIIMSMLGTDRNIHPQTLRKYIVNLLQTYMNILKKSNIEAYTSWTQGDVVCDKDLNTLADYCMKEIIYSESGNLEINELEKWLVVCSFLREAFESIMHQLCNMDVGELKPTLPVADGKTSTLRLPLVLLLSHLTRLYTKRVWRLLYDSWTDPHSWVILQMSILNQGPNLVIIEESGGFVFGGFASQSWKINTGFYGDNGCFLFRLRPDMFVCTSSSVNKHYQYLFDGKGMFPKGLAFGGFLNYFGLFLNPDFGPGQVSDTCDTFSDYEPLSEEKNFYFTRIEVWGIGEPGPKRSNESNKISFDPYVADAKRSMTAPEDLTQSFQESDRWNFV
ncbi:MTOR-associated protein MEAK7 isoform X2 [Halyomorpha halys]|nr:TLD domain-containing protein 1 isoform X2 [Halyomorpha halys]